MWSHAARRDLRSDGQGLRRAGQLQVCGVPFARGGPLYILSRRLNSCGMCLLVRWSWSCLRARRPRPRVKQSTRSWRNVVEAFESFLTWYVLDEGRVRFLDSMLRNVGAFWAVRSSRAKNMQLSSKLSNVATAVSSRQQAHNAVHGSEHRTEAKPRENLRDTPKRPNPGRTSGTHPKQATFGWGGRCKQSRLQLGGRTALCGYVHL